MNIIGAIILFYFLLVFPSLLILLPNHKRSIKQRIDIKRAIINIMFKSFDNNIEYYTKEGIAPEIYNKTGVESYDYYHSNHLMTFSINSHYKLQMAETETQYKNEQTENIVTAFAGTFATLNTPKPFRERLYIKKDMHNGKDNTAKKLPYKDMRIELDSQDFEEKFDVYASNKIIAMQLLTPDVMLLLNDFYKYIQSKFEITIKNDNIYIRIWNGATFSNSLLNPTKLDKEIIYKNYRTINFILNISKKLIELINETPYL